MMNDDGGGMAGSHVLGRDGANAVMKWPWAQLCPAVPVSTHQMNEARARPRLRCRGAPAQWRLQSPATEKAAPERLSEKGG